MCYSAPMSMLRKLSSSALRSIAEGVNRLDELGGEARDRILEWLDQSPTAARVREVVSQRRERRDQQVAEAVAADVARRQEAATSPAVPAAAPPAPLGDPTKVAQVYGKRSCPWSGRSIRLLEDRGIEHEFIDLDDSENEVLGNRLIAETKQNTVPYVFIRGEFVGGYNALSERDRLGQLEAMLDPDEAGDGRIKIEVAERPNSDEVAPATTSGSN